MQTSTKALKDKLKDSFAHVPRTMELVWRSSPRGTIAIALLTVLSAVLPLGIAYVGKTIVDAIVARDERTAITWVLVELGLIALQALVQRGLGLARTIIGMRLAADINVRILEKALTLELRHFEDSEFYDQLTRARREASSRPLSMVNGTFQLVQNALTFAGYVVLLTQFDGLAVVGLVVAAVPATIAEMRFSSMAFRLRNWRSPETRQLAYLEYVLANDEHVKEVKLFGLGETLLGRYRERAERFSREDSSLAARRTAWAFVMSLLGTLAFYGAYVAMALAAVHGQITLGTMTLYVLAFRQGQQAFQSSLVAVGGMYEDNLYMSNLFAYLAIPTRSKAPARPLTLDPQAPALELSGVGFKYPGQDRWALRNLTLTVPRGQSLALVGQNGAGKTTLIKLVTGLYEPTEGSLRVEGLDVREWDPDALRARIGVVFQDFNQYKLTLRENVGFGSIERLDDEPRLGRAVEQGGAAELLRSLPEGLNTTLGRWFREGVELSGGQWQKVALSRAFMREEAGLLILDEPTAALDAEAEHAVFERFRALTAGRTTLLISHRFPTVRMADRIVVLERGEIVEVGNHQELVALGGRYARLFELQAKGYA